MKFKTIAASLVVVLVTGVFASAGDSPDKKRDKTRKMANQTLKDLHKMKRAGFLVGSAVLVVVGLALIVLAPGRHSGERALAPAA